MVIRHRAPGWVRAMSDGTLHGIAWRLQRGFTENALSPRQDWLLTMVLDELGYRHREAVRAAGSLTACHCAMCRPVDEAGY